MGKIYRISGAAERAGVHPSTIRNYEKWGLITPQRDETGQRVFTDELIKEIKRVFAELNEGKRWQR